jgi:hypothetical protein
MNAKGRETNVKPQALDSLSDLPVYRGESLLVDVALGPPDWYESYQGLLKRIG